MPKSQARKRNLCFCPFCGLVTDVNTKGEWVNCFHCELRFMVFIDRVPEVLRTDTQKEKSCYRKVRYASLVDAHAAWIEMKHREIHNHSPMQAYLCSLCGEYHLGHAPKTNRDTAKFIIQADSIPEYLTQ